MGFAFWRPKKRAGNAAAKSATRSPPPHEEDVDPRLDPAAGLRARARHRLIGASALLLAVAIIVPMVLDPEPRPVAENIPIDIPSERAPFAPRLSLPPVPAADNVPLAPPPELPPPAVEPKAAAVAAPKSDSKPAPKVDEAKAAAVAEKSARAALEGKAAEPPASALPAVSKGGRFAVQAAAPASDKSARELSERLKKSGFSTFTEKIETQDGTRYRVRVGPYATREDAERARARLKELGHGGNVVTL
jgi:DedD protein